MNDLIKSFCPTCEKNFGDNTYFCPNDGTKLILSSQDPLAGQIFNERFKIIAKIDEGGMGAVYKARQLSTNRAVALKIVTPSLVKNPEIIQRFKREAKLQSMLQHPNIVSLIDFAQTKDGTFYFVMDYVEGESLKDKLSEYERIPIDMFYNLALQICDGMAYAHSKNIIHRDLKTDNIIIITLEHQMIVKILDFGLAKIIDDSDTDAHKLTLAGTPIGTPDYISPEQARGEIEKIAPQSDIYSMGIIFYHLLTGTLPFHGQSIIITLRKHLNERPVSPRKLNPLIPRQLNNIILKCIEKDPFKRYSSMLEIKQDLLKIASIKTMSMNFNKENTPTPKDSRVNTMFLPKIKLVENLRDTKTSVKLIVIFLGLAYLYLFLNENFNIIASLKNLVTPRIIISKNPAHDKNSFEAETIQKQISLYENKLIKSYPEPEEEIGKHTYAYKLPFIETGNIHIDTIPKKANVFINGRLYGLSPVLINDIPTGFKDVRIEKEGYQPETIQIKVIKNETVEKTLVSLQPKFGNLRVNLKINDNNFTLPVSAEIKIGSMDWKGIDIPWIEKNLRCQEYEIQIRKKGYHVLAPKLITTKVEYGKTGEVTFLLSPNPDYFYIQGRDRMLRKAFNEAISFFEKAIEIHPGFTEIYLWYGKALENTGNFDAACKSYLKFIKLSKKETAETKNIIEKLNSLQNKNDDLKKHYDKAINFYNLKSYDKAIENFSKAIEINPLEVSFLIWRGKAFSKNGETQLALSDYNNAIQINKNMPEIYYERAKINHKKDQKELAIRDYTKAIEINPSYADAYYDRAVSYYETETYQLAINDFFKAIALDPMRFAILSYHWLGYAFEAEGKSNEAINAFNAYLDIFPKNHFDFEEKNSFYKDEIERIKSKKIS